MANKCIQGKESLAKKFKFRRNELHLTIEEAALRAGVGSKTWSRYEAGDRKSTRLNSSHIPLSRMPSSA